MKESFKNRFSKWFDIVTYGDKAKYIRFIIWLFIDSFVASIPSGVMMVAIYLLLAPIMTDTAVYEQKPLWILVGILLVQTLLYALVRRKTYLDICVGHSEAQQNEKIRFGDKLGQYEILSIQETVRKGDANAMYRIIAEDAAVAAERA